MGTCGAGSISAQPRVGQCLTEVLRLWLRGLLRKMSWEAPPGGRGGAGPEVGRCCGVNWGPPGLTVRS